MAPSAATTSASPGAVSPVPARFQPASVTFVSPSTGFALGTASCGSKTCATLVVTHDGGGTWALVGTAPPVVGSDGVVSTVRFADTRDGWIFGPQLWSTHDGGRSWHQLAEPAPVSDVEAAAGNVYAVVGSRLLRSGVASDSFAPVDISLGTSASPIALHGRAAWIVGGGQGTSKLFYSADGTSWTTLADPCSALPDFTAVAVAPVSETAIYLLCGGGAGAGSESKKVLYSTDSGAHAAPTKTDPPRGGDINGFAAASATVVAIAARSGASEIYRSADSGATWETPLQQGDGGVGYHDLGFTTSSQGVAVYGQIGLGQPTSLLMTHDAGATWTRVTF